MCEKACKILSILHYDFILSSIGSWNRHMINVPSRMHFDGLDGKLWGAPDEWIWINVG